MLIVQLVILQAVTFIALVLAFRKIMYSASLNEAGRLKKLAEENAKKTEELSARISEAEKEARDKIASAQEEARKIRSAAQEEALRSRKAALESAKKDGERLLAQAVINRDSILKDADSRIRQMAVKEAAVLVGKVLASPGLQSLHESCVAEIIGEIGSIDMARIRLNSASGEVLTPYELKAGALAKIETVLSRKTGEKINLKEKQDKSVIAGIVIKLGSFVIDGSIAEKLREAAAETPGR